MLPAKSVPQMLDEAYRHFTAGQFAAALMAYDVVLARDANLPAGLLGSGFCHLSLGNFDLAAGSFQRLLAIKPDFPPALAGLGDSLIALGRPEEALSVFAILCRVDDHAAAFHGKGNALVQLGRIAEARQAFEEAIKRSPNDVHHHFALAGTARFIAGDSRLARLEAFSRGSAGLDEPAQCELHFALGKAYDELGRPAEAFSEWQAGNAIRRRNLDYDEAGDAAMVRAMAETFTAQTIAARRGAGHSSPLPVFVVGMPRSGTTLVEQILSSHPAVHGAGELMFLFRLIEDGRFGRDFPADVQAVSDACLRQSGADCVEHLRTLAPGALRVIDKLPANFLLVGLIPLILPEARIIHVRRDPADTCLSCYSQLFTADIGYSYDLGELGRYYRRYEQLMTHWHAILPEGAILDVRYEDLVADVERESRRMVEYCGLEWDPACLSFHANNRAVHTLSSVQVREPLYNRSVGRSRAYAAWLSPLYEALAGTGRQPASP